MTFHLPNNPPGFQPGLCWGYGTAASLWKCCRLTTLSAGRIGTSKWLLAVGETKIRLNTSVSQITSCQEFATQWPLYGMHWRVHMLTSNAHKKGSTLCAPWLAEDFFFKWHKTIKMVHLVEFWELFKRMPYIHADLCHDASILSCSLSTHRQW